MLYSESTFHTIRLGFYTIKLKFLPNYLHFSKLIAIFAAEFQVHLCADVRFNGSNLVKRAIDVYPVIESGQFMAEGDKQERPRD